MSIRTGMILAAATAFIAVVFPAHAQTATTPAQGVPADCPKGTLCGYTSHDHTGTLSYLGDDYAAYSNTDDYAGFLRGRSVFNNGTTWTANDGSLWGKCVTVYNSVNYKGRSIVIRPHEGVRNLDSFGHIQSNKWSDCKL